jgi:ribonucleoside-diphosphate reductase alpha chain
MQVWDAMCGTILSTGARRGAMKATLRCDHPDIEEFVAAQQQAGQLRRFNLSVLVTEVFMKAVRGKSEWPLVFPTAGVRWRRRHSHVVNGRVWRGQCLAASFGAFLPAGSRSLMLRADHAEPGVLFVGRSRVR